MRPIPTLLAFLLASTAPAAERGTGAPAGAVEEAVESPRSTVDFAVGFRGFTRNFGTTDGSTAVPAYVGAGAGVAAEATYFPAAFATRGPGGDFGLFGEGQFSVGLVTTVGTSRFATSATTLRAGLAARVPSGRHTLLIHAGFESRAFTVASTAVEGTSRPGLPDVGYLGPRAGLGYQVALSPHFALQLKAGFTWALATGQLASAAYFPSASAFAIDAAAMVSFTIVPNVELRAHGDLSRYFIALDAVHTAADQSFGGGLSLAVAL